MKLVNVGAVFIVVSIGSLLYAQNRVNEWKGLVPLHSTRTDVENIFGPPSKTYRDAFYESVYETEQEFIRVQYSEGTCRENRHSTWNVPKDTVIAVTVSPKRRTSPEEFKELFPQSFGRLVDSQTPGHVHYTNKDGSLGFLTRTTSNNKEEIIFFSVTPTEVDSTFRCIRKKKLD